MGDISARTPSKPRPRASSRVPYEDELKGCGQLFTRKLAFEPDSDKLKGTDWPVLAVVADLMKKDPAPKIRIAGHTDSTGGAAHNHDLFLRRAEAVKKTLAEKYGADASRITTKGYGADLPLAVTQIEEGSAINRRVEILNSH